MLAVLHLHGYKINNPTLLSRISHEELEYLFKGYGWTMPVEPNINAEGRKKNQRVEVKILSM